MELQSPYHLDLNVTNACNMACRHCHASSGKPLRNELDFDEWCDVLDQASELGVRSIAFAGGEPFQRPDFLQLINYAYRVSDWSIALVSNGDWPPETFYALEPYASRLRVSISIDGYDASTYGRLRVSARGAQATFKRACRSVLACREVGLRCGINCVLHRDLLQDFWKMEVLAEELGAQQLLAICFASVGRGMRSSERSGLDFKTWNDFFLSATRAKASGASPLLRLSPSAAWEFYLPLLGESDLRGLEELWRYRSFARTFPGSGRGDPAGVTELAIDADGKVYPSVLFAPHPRGACGNVRVSRLSDAWWSDHGLLSELRTYTGLQGPCSRCVLFESCGGGARANALWATGGVGSPDPRCPRVANGAS